METELVENPTPFDAQRAYQVLRTDDRVANFFETRDIKPERGKPEMEAMGEDFVEFVHFLSPESDSFSEFVANFPELRTNRICQLWNIFALVNHIEDVKAKPSAFEEASALLISGVLKIADDQQAKEEDILFLRQAARDLSLCMFSIRNGVCVNEKSAKQNGWMTMRPGKGAKTIIYVAENGEKGMQRCFEVNPINPQGIREKRKINSTRRSAEITSVTEPVEIETYKVEYHRYPTNEEGEKIIEITTKEKMWPVTGKVIAFAVPQLIL